MFSSQSWHELNVKCLRTFDSHDQLHTEGLFSRDLRGYKAVLALLGSDSILFGSEMAMDSAHYIPAEPVSCLSHH